MAGLLFLGNLLRDGNQNIHGKQTYAILVITRQVLEQGYHLINDDLCVHFLHKLGEVVGSLSPHHRSVVMHQASEVLPESLLKGRRGFLVRHAVKTGGGDFRGKPIGFGQALDHGNEILFDLLFGQLLADFVEGFDGLVHFVSINHSSKVNHDTIPTFSLTTGSSMAAKFSSGERSTCPYSGPPTYSMKLPSSSLNAVKTSSSSSTESARDIQLECALVS